MASLTKDLRRLLERTVAEGRTIAEEGAEQSLQYALNAGEKTFRSGLRAHAKQLGDRPDQRPAHLIQAVAYEHWHQLLFARFLIENDLLLHPEHGVALSLDEVKELALNQDREWVEVAADYAQQMLLRRVFQPDDPALQVNLPPEKRLELEAKLNSLPREVFLADDSLGWVYQFWQKDAKEAVNESEVRIGAAELAPVTQLFTEDYMVLFLLENTLGAWWTARHGPELPGYCWTYLRLNEEGAPSAGTFNAWPATAKELRLLDPCMGSGHFLTFALPLLTRMRIAEEGLSLSDAVCAVLRDNLFGLELDPRCSQIAAFNLALTAWKLAGRHFDIPQVNLACSGLGINTDEQEWLGLAGADGRKQDLMRWLYELFNNAPTFGSLIDPRSVGKPIVDSEVAALMPLLEQAIAAERLSDDDRELTIAAKGVIASARILSTNFHLVTTNVPYLKSGNQSPLLKAFCAQHYSLGKSDLATCFIQRCLSFCVPGGTAALVAPQNWLFQPAYVNLRSFLLKSFEWNCLAELGPHAFETISGEVVKVCLAVMTRTEGKPDDSFAGIDVSQEPDVRSKAVALKNNPITSVLRLRQIDNPEHRIVISGSTRGPLLSVMAKSHKGITTNDDPRFVRKFWELPKPGDGWEFHLSTVHSTIPYGGRKQILKYESGKGELRALAKSQDRDRRRDLQGINAWGKLGVAVSCTGSLPVSFYTGEKFDTNVAVLIPHDPRDLMSLYEFCKSPEFNAQVRRIDKALKVTNSTLVKIPYNREGWRASATDAAERIPPAESNDPTQWLFNGSLKKSEQPLQTVLAGLLGYRWPRQTGSTFLACPDLEPVDSRVVIETDGIVCLTPTAGKESAANQLRALLQSEFGDSYNPSRLLQGKKSGSIEEWLRDEFFEEHCRLFDDRPFIWHVWDGLKDGFHALVNYHKLDRGNLEKLIYSYLGDWVARQKKDIESGLEGADTRLSAAEHLQNELKKILQGEVPYDIFVRWKQLKAQAIGWAPDLNDGIRVNIRPWIADAQSYKAKKPGILRVTPKINYAKDPGQEPVRDAKEFPWFKDTRNRNNDIHLSLEEKRRARGLA
jgi:hypothetical protein